MHVDQPLWGGGGKPPGSVTRIRRCELYATSLFIISKLKMASTSEGSHGERKQFRSEPEILKETDRLRLISPSCEKECAAAL